MCVAPVSCKGPLAMDLAERTSPAAMARPKKACTQQQGDHSCLSPCPQHMLASQAKSNAINTAVHRNGTQTTALCTVFKHAKERNVCKQRGRTKLDTIQYKHYIVHTPRTARPRRRGSSDPRHCAALWPRPSQIVAARCGPSAASAPACASGRSRPRTHQPPVGWLRWLGGWLRWLVRWLVSWLEQL